MHFITLTVPPPRIDHSLMHNSTRGMSPGQKCLQVRFRENVRFGPFSWVVAHDFQDSSQIFATSRICTDSIYKTFGEVMIDFWTLWYPFRGLFRPVYVHLEPRSMCLNGSQNDAFHHSDGPSSTYRP
jgi:hypothetical protein